MIGLPDTVQVLTSRGTAAVHDPLFKVKCPLCDTWCDAKPTSEEPVLDLARGDNAAMVHVDITLHVHDHDCAEARKIMADAISLFTEAHSTPKDVE